jgi:hypothetical protein
MCRTFGLAFFSVISIACGPGKQLPDASQRVVTGPQPPPAATVPAKSDEKAKAIVDAALKATSGGDVSRIEKVKAFRSSAKGFMSRPVGGQNLSLETTREFETVWPNACRLRIESQSLKPFTLGLRRPLLWTREGDQPMPIPDPRAAEESVAIDTVGHNWILFLVPLLDPKTVVFEPNAITLGDKKLKVVKAAVPGYPVFTLTFDAADLLVQVEYTNFETGAWVTKVLGLDAHKPFGGIMLPTKVESVRNGVPVERWVMSKWEAVEKIDDATFDPPK